MEYLLEYNQYTAREYKAPVKVLMVNNNLKFNIFMVDHAIDRKEERDILDDDILELIEYSIKHLVYFSLHTNFAMKDRIVLKDDLIDLNIPISIKNVNNDRTIYDLYVYTAMRDVNFRVREGQYVVVLNKSENKGELYQMIKGNLLRKF